MTRRRTFLIGGAGVAAVAVVGGVQAAGRWDDVARWAGVDPVPRPTAADRVLLAAAADDQAALVALASGGDPAVLTLLTEQLDALGGPAPAVPPATGPLSSALTASATLRTGQALEAESPDLARTLGSIAVGLRVLATRVGP